MVDVIASDWVVQILRDQDGNRWPCVVRHYAFGDQSARQLLDLKLLSMAVDPVAMMAHADNDAHIQLGAN